MKDKTFISFYSDASQNKILPGKVLNFEKAPNRVNVPAKVISMYSKATPATKKAKIISMFS